MGIDLNADFERARTRPEAVFLSGGSVGGDKSVFCADNRFGDSAYPSNVGSLVVEAIVIPGDHHQLW